MTTANVFPLFSRDRNPETATTCQCYPHQLDRLAARLSDVLDRTERELLIDRDTFAATVTDALTVARGIAGECLPENERANP